MLQDTMFLLHHDFVYPRGYTHFQMQEISDAAVCFKTIAVHHGFSCDVLMTYALKRKETSPRDFSRRFYTTFWGEMYVQTSFKYHSS